MIKKRESFLDVLKIMAACMVILIHIISGFMNMPQRAVTMEQERAMIITMDFLTWCVPVFLMVTGYLLLNPMREISFSMALFKYCKRIFLALLIFGVPFACMELIMVNGTFDPAMIPKALLMVACGKGWSHMWYLYMLLFLYLFTPLIKKMLRILPTFAIYGIMLLLLTSSSILPFLGKVLNQEGLPGWLDRGIYLFYYLCGYLLSVKSAGKKQAAEHKKSSRSVVLLLLLLLVVSIGMIVSRALGWYAQMAYNYPPTVLFSLLLVLLVREKEPLWQKMGGGRIEKLSALSFTVYLIHPVFINFIYKFLNILPTDYPLPLSIPLFFLLIGALSIAGAWILRKISFLRKHVL